MFRFCPPPPLSRLRPANSRFHPLFLGSDSFQSNVLSVVFSEPPRSPDPSSSFFSFSFFFLTVSHPLFSQPVPRSKLKVCQPLRPAPRLVLTCLPLSATRTIDVPCALLTINLTINELCSNVHQLVRTLTTSFTTVRFPVFDTRVSPRLSKSLRQSKSADPGSVFLCVFVFF